MGTWNTCYAVPWRPGEARPGQGDKRPVLGVGWAASDPQPGSFLLWLGGAGPALVCSCLFVWPLTSTLAQICGGTPQDAALSEPKATLPEA